MAATDISLLKVTFTFDKRYYDKYDIFRYGDYEYICSSRPRQNEDGTWSIDVIQKDYPLLKETKWIGNTVNEYYEISN